MRLNGVVVYLALCAMCWQITLTNSRSSTLWRLNIDDGKITGRVLAADKENVFYNLNSDIYPNDEIFNIITSTMTKGMLWSKRSSDTTVDAFPELSMHQSAPTVNSIRMDLAALGGGEKKLLRDGEDTLDCGKPVNFTYYDYLIGVAQRFNHPLVPEPEVAYTFLKNKDEKSLKNFDIGALEKRLKRAKRDKPRSVYLYNQIGNYFRIVGDARQAIECYRRALAMSPTNAEVLLNLARVLYNLQYLDDAIHLTRRSLEVQPPDRSAWRQYFTLGEIFKAYGHFQESILHLRHALALYPQHEPILKALRDVESSPSTSLHFYTILIIAALIIAVFIVIITSSSGSDGCTNGNLGPHNECEPKMQRHFNRAMAMRSLKGFSSKSCKQKKY